jgi:hypothetical protein
MSLGDFANRFFGRKLVTAVAGAALVASLGATTPALAQGVNGYHNSYSAQARRLNASDIQRMAMVNGYSEGYEDGVEARRTRSGSNYQIRQSYRDALRGFSSEWGWTDRRVYQNSFRQGYGRGYVDGYNSRNRNRQYERAYVFRSYDPFRNYPGYTSGGYNNGGYYGSNGVQVGESLGQTAATNGYNDGFGRGAYDRQSGRRSPNPQGHGAFQQATNGYTDDLNGGMGQYQQIYRQYFIQGYNDAFAGRSQNRGIRWRY